MGNRRLSLIHEDLHDSWDACSKCSVASCHKVYYRGPESPMILFIAATLDVADTVTGRPLSGLAGRLLDQLASDCGLSKKQYGVTTLTSCITTKEGQASFIRDPTKEEVQNCSERLDEVIETFLPDYYICLGATVKKNAPEGITFALELKSHLEWEFSGRDESLHWKRDRHKLKKFLREVRSGSKKEED